MRGLEWGESQSPRKVLKQMVAGFGVYRSLKLVQDDDGQLGDDYG